MQNLHFVYQKEILDSSFIFKDRIYFKKILFLNFYITDVDIHSEDSWSGLPDSIIKVNHWSIGLMDMSRKCCEFLWKSKIIRQFH